MSKFDELTITLSNGKKIDISINGEIEFSHGDATLILYDEKGNWLFYSDMKTEAEKQWFLMIQAAAEERFEGMREYPSFNPYKEYMVSREDFV